MTLRVDCVDYFFWATRIYEEAPRLKSIRDALTICHESEGSVDLSCFLWTHENFRF